jgi:hypothetical protein
MLSKPWLNAGNVTLLALGLVLLGVIALAVTVL